MSKILRLSLVALVLSLMSAVAMAQSSLDGAIGGTVKDPNGAVVPNATVMVKNEETNKEATATTDSEGRFRVVQLQPGNYTVSINASGFGAFNQSKIVVEVGRVTSLDIPLSVGGVGGDQIEVTGEAPVINTTQQDFSSNVNQTSINELPINGRRASNFVLLTPGVVPDGNFGLISFRGISGLLNNNTVDGGDNNNAFYSEERGRTRISYVVSQAAVREFQVNTSNYSAEYGRAAGGVVNTVTQSGTNEFHGSLFYYIRDNKLGATNPTTTRTVLVGGVPVNQTFKPEDKRQQFGGSIGGRIIKDRLFFFFAYDEQRREFPGAAVFPNATYLSAVNRATLMARSPLITNARIDQALAFLSSLTGPVPRSQDQRIFFPKIDWVINNSNTFTASYNRMRSQSPSGIETQPTTFKGIATFGDDFVETDSLNLRLTSTITPTLLNEARFQYGRDNLFAFSVPPSPGEAILATAPGGRPPTIVVNGFTFGKQDFLERVANPDEKRWQYADTMTWNYGRHTFKFGGDINRVNDLLDNLRLEAGSYTYSNINDFIVDYTNVRGGGDLRTANVPCFTLAPVPPAPQRIAGRCYTSNYQQAFGPTAFRISTTDYNFFFQDDIRVTPKLTVNLGMRYEYEQLPEPQIPSTLSNLPTQFVGPDQTRSLPSDKNNFGPRFGFAYDITGDGKTSIRGGYGIYYGRIINSTIINAISNTGTVNAQRTFSLSATATGAPVFPNVFTAPPAITTAAPAIVVFSENMAAPQIHQADIVFERQIMPNTVVSVSYLASLGRRLPTFTDRNLPNPVNRTFTFVGGPLGGQAITVPFFTGARPDARFGAITEITGSIKSEYQALVLQANRRLSKGLQFQVNYTFSKSTDTGQNSATFTFTNGPLNPFDLSLEGGRSNLDIPHRFVASAVWTPGLPFGLENSKVGKAIFGGFTISPIVTAQSGVAYSANVSGFGPSSIGGGITGSGALGRIPLVYERNAFRQPRLVNVDLRVSRRFRFTESMNLEFLAEAFNLFNRYQVTGVNTTQYTFSGSNLNFLPNGPNFGVPNSTGNSIYRERQIQFALRFHF